MSDRPIIHYEPPPVTGKKYQFVQTESRYNAAKLARDMMIDELWLFEQDGKLWAAWVEK